MAVKLTKALIAKSRVIARGRAIREVQRLAETYGGVASNWVKKSSPRVMIDGNRPKSTGMNATGLVDSKKRLNGCEVKVRLKKNSMAKYTEFTPGNVYAVIGIEADDFRIMNDLGRPYLYPAGIFEIVDSTPGVKWHRTTGSEGEHYAYPPELSTPGFFEDYFDGDRSTQSVLEAYLLYSRKKNGKGPRGKAARAVLHGRVKYAVAESDDARGAVRSEEQMEHLQGRGALRAGSCAQAPDAEARSLNIRLPPIYLSGWATLVAVPMIMRRR